jgi:hypothetical protein
MLKKALTTLAATAFVAMLAGTAQAGIVDCEASSATGGGFKDLCPQGDGDAVSLSLTLLDFFNNPVVNFPADSVEVECPGIVFFAGQNLKADSNTNGSGGTTITLNQAGYDTDGYCDDVGVTIHNGVHSCMLDIATRAGLTIKFFDLNGSSLVDGVDFTIFAGHWLSADPECDYNESGLTDGVDFTIFAGHWLDSD